MTYEAIIQAKIQIEAEALANKRFGFSSLSEEFDKQRKLNKYVVEVSFFRNNTESKKNAK